MVLCFLPINIHSVIYKIDDLFLCMHVSNIITKQRDHDIVLYLILFKRSRTLTTPVYESENAY